MPKAIKVIGKKKGWNGGRKAYTDEKQFSIPIQFYKKAADIELLGGLEVVRNLAKADFDQRLAKKKGE